MIGRCEARISRDATGKFSSRWVFPDRDGLFVMAPHTRSPGNGSFPKPPRSTPDRREGQGTNSTARGNEPDGPSAVVPGNIEAAPKRRGPQSEAADRERSCFPLTARWIFVAHTGRHRNIHGAVRTRGD